MPKRSLMLAGGGVKIAFQAWLDEAGIEFDHGDAVSAACVDVLSDTTVLFAKIYRGMVLGDEEGSAEVVASGILVGMIAFLKQLATFRADGPTLADRTSALTRFGVFYFGRLWDVYARRLLSSGPF